MRTLKTHTIAVPSDYVSELRNKAQRKKSRAFFEYFYDIEVGEHNSYSFYAKSWEVGKGTAHRWVEEFNKALEIFDSARELKRITHYEKAIKNTPKKDDAELCKKSAGTIGTIEVERLEHHQAPIISSLQKSDGTVGTIAIEQSFNIINNNKDDAFLDNEFYKFISELKMSIKNIGNIDDIYISYKKVKDLIDLKTLSKIYREYSSETKSDRKVGLAKFLDDLMYLSYCNPYIELENDGSYIVGTWDKNRGVLISKDKNYGLSISRYSELNNENKIKVIKYMENSGVLNG
jgi:hypothetical protein